MFEYLNNENVVKRQHKVYKLFNTIKINHQVFECLICNLNSKNN